MARFCFCRFCDCLRRAPYRALLWYWGEFCLPAKAPARAVGAAGGLVQVGACLRSASADISTQKAKVQNGFVF